MQINHVEAALCELHMNYSSLSVSCFLMQLIISVSHRKVIKKFKKKTVLPLEQEVPQAVRSLICILEDGIEVQHKPVDQQESGSTYNERYIRN